MSAAKKSRNSQRRSGLSFAGANGSLDVEEILKTEDIWKEVDKFEGTVAGKVQNVLDTFRDTLAQEPSPGKKNQKADNIEKIPKQRASLNPKNKNDNVNEPMKIRKRSAQDAKNISASTNATNEISTNITTKKFATKSVTKIPTTNLSKPSPSSAASISKNKQSNISKTTKKEVKDAFPMTKQTPKKVKNLTVQSQSDIDDAKKTAKISPKSKDNTVNKSTKVIKKQQDAQDVTKNISEFLSPSVTSTSSVSMNKSNNISKTVEKKEKVQHDTDDAKKTAKKSPKPKDKDNTVNKPIETIKKQFNQNVTNKVLTSTPKRSPMKIEIKREIEEKVTKDAENEPGDVEEMSEIQKQHAKHNHNAEVVKTHKNIIETIHESLENIEEYLKVAEVSSSEPISKEELINKMKGWIMDIKKIILRTKKLLKKRQNDEKHIRNNKKIIELLTNHGERTKAVIKKINKVKKKYENNESDSNSNSELSYSNSNFESSYSYSSSESSDYSSNSDYESSDCSSSSESSTSINSIDTYNSDDDFLQHKTKFSESMKKYRKRIICENCRKCIKKKKYKQKN